jgi:hypothetical protein
LSTIPSTSAQALADRAIADTIKLAWIDINATSKLCLNCHAMGHSAGACWKERRAELPCQICFGDGSRSAPQRAELPRPSS